MIWGTQPEPPLLWPAPLTPIQQWASTSPECLAPGWALECGEQLLQSLIDHLELVLACFHILQAWIFGKPKVFSFLTLQWAHL